MLEIGGRRPLFNLRPSAASLRLEKFTDTLVQIVEDGLVAK